MFINNNSLEMWLAEIADVEPYIGGKFELFWDKDNLDVNCTKGCKVTAIEVNKQLSFEWKGPLQFASFMNDVESLTQVTVKFIPDNNNTEIHLIHKGWKNDAR